MPTPDEMTDTVRRYAAAHSAGDVDAVAALFADDAVLLDPVDAPAHHGRDAVRAFFAGTHEMLDSMELLVTGPVRAVGEWAAVPLQARSQLGGSVMEVDIIDVFTFNDDGLITEMRAYWSSADIRTVS
ncbi:MAG: nuclear transport factor 2 family protein [Microthrixaceae bacterium]|jgi:steroid delta-isomerase